MDYKVSERLEQTDRNRKWPWDWRNEALTKTASMKIVKNLALYANDAMYRKPEEVGVNSSLDEGFLHYCFCVKDYFIKAAEKAPKYLKPKVSEIAEEALRLISGLESIVAHPNDNTCSWLELISQWDTVVRKLDMCVISGEQQEQPAETGQSATAATIINIDKLNVLRDIQAESVQTGDYSSIHKQTITTEKKKSILIRILKIIGAIIVGIIGSLIAAILFQYFW